MYFDARHDLQSRRLCTQLTAALFSGKDISPRVPSAGKLGVEKMVILKIATHEQVADYLC
jgi:hypothetical protein